MAIFFEKMSSFWQFLTVFRRVSCDVISDVTVTVTTLKSAPSLPLTNNNNMVDLQTLNERSKKKARFLTTWRMFKEYGGFREFKSEVKTRLKAEYTTRWVPSK